MVLEIVVIRDIQVALRWRRRRGIGRGAAIAAVGAVAVVAGAVNYGCVRRRRGGGRGGLGAEVLPHRGGGRRRERGRRDGDGEWGWEAGGVEPGRGDGDGAEGGGWSRRRRRSVRRNAQVGFGLVDEGM